MLRPSKSFERNNHKGFCVSVILYTFTIVSILFSCFLNHRFEELFLQSTTTSPKFPPSWHHQPCPYHNRTSSSTITTANPLFKEESNNNQYQIEWLPDCNDSNISFWKECVPSSTSTTPSVDVILTVYKRNNLRIQLEMIRNQTVLPSNIFIYQTIRTNNNNNNNHDVPSIIQEFQRNFTNFTVPIHTIQAPVDTARYHGRFYMAHTMSRAKYISVWDDDLTVGPGWLERVLDFLASQKDMVIVSSGGRLVDKIPDFSSNATTTRTTTTTTTVQYGTMQKRTGYVDFVVHNYNLRRELLRYWLGAPVHTYYTGEDMQLAATLQKYGVLSYKLGGRPHGNDYATASKGLGANDRKYASWKKKKASEARQWLLCQLIKDGFQTRQCQNCNDTKTVQHCLDYFEKKKQ